MVEGFLTNQEKLEFKQIVLQHLKKILDISTNEFTGGYWKTVYHGSQSEHIYVPDMRACYVQAVLSLSDVLLPHFDKEMTEQSNKLEEEIDENKIYKRLKEERLEETTNEESKKEVEKSNRKDWNINILEERLVIARKLFQQLNLLLKRKDYLNKAVFSEEDDEPKIGEIE